MDVPVRYAASALAAACTLAFAAARPALAAGAASAPAAATPDTAAVLAVDTGGTIPDASVDKLREGLAAGLAASGFDVVPPARTSAALAGDGAASACREGACLSDLATKLGARYLLLATVRREGDGYTSALRLVDGASAAVVSSSDASCELCAFARLREQITIGASSLRARLLAERATADDVARHKAEVERKAAEEMARITAAASGARPTFPWPSLGLGAVGLAAVGLSIWFFAVDGDDACRLGDPVYPGDPDGLIEFPDPEDPSIYRCRYQYATLPFGVVALAAGTAALAATGIWIGLAMRPRDAAASSPPAAGVSVGPGGLRAFVRW